MALANTLQVSVKYSVIVPKLLNRELPSVTRMINSSINSAYKKVPEYLLMTGKRGAGREAGTTPSLSGLSDPSAPSPDIAGRAQEHTQKKILTLETLQTSLHFEVDSSTGKVVVQFIDRESGEVVQQIPQDTSKFFSGNSEKKTGLIIDSEV